MTRLNRVICFDGPERSGKTTQLTLTRRWLEQLGFEVAIWKAVHPKDIIIPDINVDLSDSETIGWVFWLQLQQMFRDTQDDMKFTLVDRSVLSMYYYNVYTVPEGRIRERVREVFHALIEKYREYLPRVFIVYLWAQSELRKRKDIENKERIYSSKLSLDIAENMKSTLQFSPEWLNVQLIDGITGEERLFNRTKEVLLNEFDCIREAREK